MEPEIDKIKKTFAGFTDAQIINIAMKSAHGMRPDAEEVLRNEITKRGLDKALFKSIDYQKNPRSREELYPQCELLRSLPCPKCGNNTERLNAVTIRRVVSFIVFSDGKKWVQVACPACLKKNCYAAIVKTILLGWWHLPLGPIKTVRAIGVNIHSLSRADSGETNKELFDFVAENIGYIEANKKKPEALRDLLIEKNE